MDDKQVLEALLKPLTPNIHHPPP